MTSKICCTIIILYTLKKTWCSFFSARILDPWKKFGSFVSTSAYLSLLFHCPKSHRNIAKGKGKSRRLQLFPFSLPLFSLLISSLSLFFPQVCPRCSFSLCTFHLSQIWTEAKSCYLRRSHAGKLIMIPHLLSISTQRLRSHRFKTRSDLTSETVWRL